MGAVKSDIEIARAAKMKPIKDILGKIKVPDNNSSFSPMGRHIAKINLEYLNKLKNKKDGHLILVTAITPTPAGEGKTTTSVGLHDGLNKIGKKSIVCLREPSLGPSFGMKGGAAGGGYAQVVPMEQINLHFTGDFHAITSAHNLLSALIDNHIYWGNKLKIDDKRIVWKRVVDMNDRALRFININTKGVAKEFPREDGFDITVASEVMAIFCLSNENLKNRGNFDDYANKAIVELWHGSKDCKLVVDLMDKSLDLGKHRWNLYSASAVYSHCGEYDKALSSARLGLELLPNDPRWAITSSLVSTLFKMSKFKEVVEALEKNINAPDVGGLILGVYTASQIELGNMNKAKKMFSRIQKNGRLKKSIIKTRMFPKGDTADRLIDSLEKIGPIPD